MSASRIRYIRNLFLFVSLLFLIAIPVSLHIMAQQKYPQEEVTVIAVEVPVRVLIKGKAVKDLIKDDFEIYENGIKQEITAFEVASRKIAISKEVTADELLIPPKPRLFFLIFNIFDYNDKVGEGIDYFFENIFQPGDKFIVLTEDKLLNIDIGKSLPEIVLDLKETLKQAKVISTGTTVGAYRALDTEIYRLENTSLAYGYNPYIRFIDNYIRIWKEYKRLYISPDLRLYQSVLSRIKQIEGDKWALCFQQRELFPRLKRLGRLYRKIEEFIALYSRSTSADYVNQTRMLKTKLNELNRNLDYVSTFPNELLRDIFMEANVTFHLILLKSVRHISSQDFKLREVAQDYEDCFRQISFATGGYTTFSNKVTEALQGAVEVEDFHYLLVYSPKDVQEDKKREIDVKVNRKGARVIHLENIRRMLAPPIAISDLNIGDKSVIFLLKNYKQEKVEGKLQGIVEMQVTLFDENSDKVYDRGGILNLDKESTDVNLNFRALKSGTYFIIIQVVDKITNEVDVYSANITL